MTLAMRDAALLHALISRTSVHDHVCDELYDELDAYLTSCKVNTSNTLMLFDDEFEVDGQRLERLLSNLEMSNNV